MKKYINIGLDGNEANQTVRVGSGVYALEILKKLVKNLNNNWEISVYLKNRQNKEMPVPSRNLKYKIIRPAGLWTQIVLPLNLWKEKITGTAPDIFFSPSHFGPRFSPVPTVITVFDLSFLSFPDLFLKKDLYKLKNWTRYSIKQAKGIITISEFSKREIIKNYQIPPGKIHVAYPGYDPERFKIRSVSQLSKLRFIKNKYGIAGDYILYIGTLQPRKNAARLLEAFKDVKKTSPGLKLVMTGMVNEGRGGWMQSEFFTKLKELNLKDEVIITGYLPSDEIPLLLNGALTLVLPSLYEGFGIPIVEAMASGCPVVVSNVSSLPEIAGEAGILVDPYSPENISSGIIEACYNQSRREEMIKKGLQLSLKFNWNKSAETILTVLQNLA